MNRQVKVSVILPSLNVVQYIRECVESVMHQSLQDIEIICVDGNSTDGTLEILREYEAKDERIQIIVSNERSYGHQMNLGIEAAQGEYLGIVETDDYVLPHTFEALYRTAKENQAEFVKSDYYRFSGDGEARKQEIIPLRTDKSFYNRVIDVEREQNCFLMVMNTWTGIYSRAFLQKYRICHNETPGASYQDNGFWFQTMMYAKRAFFWDQPGYMHRRDNPGSSMNNKGKVFCICDEYEFIHKILKKDEAVYQKFKYTYVLACYRAYIGNLMRIADEYRPEFLQKMAEDFRQFLEQGELNIQIFGKWEQNVLSAILEDTDLFYRQYIWPSRILRDAVLQQKKIIIYGAGKVGKNAYQRLSLRKTPVEIFCYAVSDMDENPSEYQGVPVYNIDTLEEYREKSLVIIAVSGSYEAEIWETLKKLKFSDVLSMKDIRYI